MSGRTRPQTATKGREAGGLLRPRVSQTIAHWPTVTAFTCLVNIQALATLILGTLPTRWSPTKIMQRRLGCSRTRVKIGTMAREPGSLNRPVVSQQALMSRWVMLLCFAMDIVAPIIYIRMAAVKYRKTQRLKSIILPTLSCSQGLILVREGMAAYGRSLLENRHFGRFPEDTSNCCPKKYCSQYPDQC